MTDAAALIVGIGGSTGASSVTNLLLRACLDQSAAMGARTVAFTGAQLAEFPIFDANRDAAAPAAAALVTAVRAADAVILATPGYHGGMSGLVKNAIDHLELLRDDERPYLDGRAVGIIVAASGWQACGTTLVSVRSAVHALRGWPTPFGVTVNSAEQQPGADGSFDERITGALRILATQVTDFTGWRAAARATSAR
ncbi:MAG: NADPH-dependent FMN reductase [Jatrophihabitantaceae bacterium]